MATRDTRLAEYLSSDPHLLTLIQNMVEYGAPVLVGPNAKNRHETSINIGCILEHACSIYREHAHLKYRYGADGSLLWGDLNIQMIANAPIHEPIVAWNGSLWMFHQVFANNYMFQRIDPMPGSQSTLCPIKGPKLAESNIGNRMICCYMRGDEMNIIPALADRRLFLITINMKTCMTAYRHLSSAKEPPVILDHAVITYAASVDTLYVIMSATAMRVINYATKRTNVIAITGRDEPLTEYTRGIYYKGRIFVLPTKSAMMYTLLIDDHATSPAWEQVKTNNFPGFDEGDATYMQLWDHYIVIIRMQDAELWMLNLCNYTWYHRTCLGIRPNRYKVMPSYTIMGDYLYCVDGTYIHSSGYHRNRVRRVKLHRNDIAPARPQVVVGTPPQPIQRGRYPDFSFEIAGQKISAHRCVLARNATFDKHFTTPQDGTRGSDIEAMFKGCKPSVVDAFIDYFYAMPEVWMLSVNLIELYAIARRFNEEPLVLAIIDEVHMWLDNADEFYGPAFDSLVKIDLTEKDLYKAMCAHLRGRDSETAGIIFAKYPHLADQ